MHGLIAAQAHRSTHPLVRTRASATRRRHLIVGLASRTLIGIESQTSFRLLISAAVAAQDHNEDNDDSQDDDDGSADDNHF